MALPAPSPRDKLHTRTITCEGFRRQDGLWDIDAHITDVKGHDLPIRERGILPAGEILHEMWLRVTIDDHFVIQDIIASTEASPWAFCTGATAAFAQLKGVALTSGFMNEVRQRVARRDVCTHILELLRPVATAAFQTVHVAPAQDGKSRGGGNNPALLDTCYAFRSDGPIVRAIWPDLARETQP